MDYGQTALVLGRFLIVRKAIRFAQMAFLLGHSCCKNAAVKPIICSSWPKESPKMCPKSSYFPTHRLFLAIKDEKAYNCVNKKTPNSTKPVGNSIMTPKAVIKKNDDFIEVTLPVVLFQEGDQFVSYCPALELSSYGNSENEARQSFDEALEIFLEETTRKGTLEKYLLKKGWLLRQKPRPIYEPPSLSLRESKEIINRKNAGIYDERINIPVA
jgi:predicted RNase H-like HicB family nuclease